MVKPVEISIPIRDWERVVKVLERLNAVVVVILEEYERGGKHQVPGWAIQSARWAHEGAEKFLKSP